MAPPRNAAGGGRGSANRPGASGHSNGNQAPWLATGMFEQWLALLLYAGIQSLYTVTEAVFRAKVQAQPGSQDEARAKRLKDSIRMLAQPLGHLQQQAQRLTEQQRRTQIRAQMAAGSSASIMLRSDPPGRLHPDGPKHDNDHLDFRCISITPTQQQVLCTKAPFLPRNRRPENPWVFMLGLIHVGPDVGFGVYGVLCPALSHVTQHHLEQLPATVKEEFPQARSIALAGRLPGLMTAAGVPIKAPIVDGLSGTVFAMEATVRALINNLPAERKANPTVAILGGGGYIGSRLSSVLATSPPEPNTSNTISASKDKSLLAPQASFSLEVEPASGDAVKPAVGMTAAVTLRDKSPVAVPVLKQIIALDTRYVGNRHSKGGVLYTAEAADLESADVVLVITRNGDDVAEYVKHAQPGQEWGDDTHPEIGREVLRALAARGVNVHKAMATRSPPTALLPPLAGWPVAGTPGCLLMALVSAATHTDWNGAGTALVAGQDASKDTYWGFAAATKALGFHAMLTCHRRSRVEEDSTKDV